jgi:hypothetical protein
VCHRTRKRDQLAIVENRQSKDQVIEMAAHGVTIIGEQNVARLDVFLAPELDFRLDRIGKSADEHRQAQADGDRVAVGIEKTDGEVLGFVNNRVVRRAHQVGLHLAGDRHHRAPDHLGSECVDPRSARNLRLHRSLCSRFQVQSSKWEGNLEH